METLSYLLLILDDDGISVQKILLWWILCDGSCISFEELDHQNEDKHTGVCIILQRLCTLSVFQVKSTVTLHWTEIRPSLHPL